MTDVQDDGGRRPLVLVVDDDAAVSAALDRSLRRLGYQVLIARDGTEGFEQALRAEPGVVFADVHMPGMDGHALLRRLTLSRLPVGVVLMSGRGELDDAISALREGAVDYLKKPWTAGELVAALDRALSLSDALRDLSLPPTLARSTARTREPGTTAAVDVPGLLQRLADGATSETLALPPLHPVVARLRRGDTDADQWVDDVSRLIDQDPSLSLALLRLASGTHDPERHSGDVRNVVVAMGGESVHATIEMLTLRDAFPIAVAPLRTLNERIWRFSVSRGLAMKGIASIADVDGKLDPHQYGLAGLLMDVGASYLLSIVAAEMQRIGGGLADSLKMTAAVAAHHGRIGALVLQRWELPSVLVDLVRNHHGEPPQSPGPLWCASALGGALAVRLAGVGDPTGERELKPELLARCAYTLGVGDTVLRRLTTALSQDAAQVWAAACA